MSPPSRAAKSSQGPTNGAYRYLSSERSLLTATISERSKTSAKRKVTNSRARCAASLALRAGLAWRSCFACVSVPLLERSTVHSERVRSRVISAAITVMHEYLIRVNLKEASKHGPL